MDRIKLHEEFIKALLGKNTRKSELTNIISDILRIERESAARRLNGKVQFSVQEMGVLAKELGISLDALIHKDEHHQNLPLLFQSPVMLKSFDVVCDAIDNSIALIEKITQEPAEFGSVFNSIPIEYFAYYPALTKFMFFKWGYYFIKTEKFDDFAKWKLPERLLNLKEKCEMAFANTNSTFMIWDDSLVATLVKEIDNFHKMKIVSTADKNAIRDDLKALLINLEQYIKGTYHSPITIPDIKFFVSSVNIGVTCCYCLSENMHSALFQTNFIHSTITENSEICSRLKDWIYSLQDISLLLSGSAHVERRLFFNAQHNQINNMLN